MVLLGDDRLEPGLQAAPGQGYGGLGVEMGVGTLQLAMKLRNDGGMDWRRSSYSGNSGGNCTEVATVPDAVRYATPGTAAVRCSPSDARVDRVRGSPEGGRT